MGDQFSLKVKETITDITVVIAGVQENLMAIPDCYLKILRGFKKKNHHLPNYDKEGDSKNISNKPKINQQTKGGRA